MKVSIIVPCWGHPDLAEQLVEGISKTTGVDFELILVDNGSGVPGDLPKYKWLKVINPGKNLGMGQGSNFGVQYATGDTILFLNNDIVIENPDWLFKLVQPLKENPKRLVGHELIKWNEFTRVRGNLHPYINGYCMLMKKELFDKTGGFNADFGLGWFEDVYLSHKAEAMGYELYEQKTTIRHLGSQTIFDGRLNTGQMMVQAGYHFRDKIVREQIPQGKLRIVFMCAGNYSFSDESWEGKGVGGAEASLILLSRELAKLGHQVEIYNDPDKHGEQNGVYYYDVKEFRYTDYCDVFIVYRNPVKFVDKVNAALKLFWSCDQYTVGNFVTNTFPFVDKVICISPYHVQYFKETYFIEDEKITYFNLGVNLIDYEQKVSKIPGKLLYCSVPHRGLEYLYDLFPRIRQQVPNAELFITSDYTLWGVKDPDNHDFRSFENLSGVHFLGKIDRKELVKHQLEAEIMAYPCSYYENFCISAAECLAAGAVPVTSNVGALPTTVGKDGIVLNSKPKEPGFSESFVSSIVYLLKDNKEREKLAERGRERAKKHFDWSKLAKQWEKFLYFEKDKAMLNLSKRLPSGLGKLSVLDLGCGIYESGVSNQIPLLKFKSYTGVDIWEDVIKQNQKGSYATSDIKFYKSDIDRWLRGNIQKYDLIFLFDILEHFKKEEGLKLLKEIEKICKKRIVIFMPIGNHTLEANDGKTEKNPYQKHQSEWNLSEWEDLGYDVELLKGFHHGGILDAAWIMKDTNYMKKCSECGRTFNSSYYLAKHKVIHGTPESQKAEKKGIPLAHDAPPKLPDVKIYLKQRIDLSVNALHFNSANELQVPYEQMADIMRIITEAYGQDMILKHELLEKT